jgi:hypothetical protein
MNKIDFKKVSEIWLKSVRNWRKGSNSGQNRVKYRYCPKLGAATLISVTEVFFKKKRAQET